MNQDGFIVRVAHAGDVAFAEVLCEAYQVSAKARGIGIAQRSAEYIAKKICEQKAIIACNAEGHLAGFCYIESWNHERFVVNSGLIVLPEFRLSGLARRIKDWAFQLSRELYPHAKIFGLTTSSAIMKINSELGYRPAGYNELTDDPQFWQGCKSCVNYAPILVAKEFKHCLCTGMLFDPVEKDARSALAKLGPRDVVDTEILTPVKAPAPGHEVAALVSC